MNLAASEPREWLSQMAEQATSVAMPNNNWLDSMRKQAGERIKTQIIPHRKQELWRYSNVDQLFKQTYASIKQKLDAIQLDDIDEFLMSETDTHRLVLLNGIVSDELSNTNHLPEGVRLESLKDALKQNPEMISRYINQTEEDQQHVFTLLNTASINDGVYLHIDEGIQLEKPVEIINVSLSIDEAIIIQPRNVCILNQGASATIIERYVSTGDSHYFNNNLMEITLEKDARLTHYRLQQESHNARHLGSIFVSQQTSSEYINNSFSLGASWSRTEYDVDFRGEYAQCHLKGLYTVGDDQIQDFHLNIHHDIPNCSSSENFKGILHGKGRAIFDGLIYVAKDAQKTDAHLSNRNLMLSRQAEIDSKPQLEIYADDVQCSHGTTIGELEQQQVFYLRSRGIPEDTAKRMLCLGFAGEVINNIEIEPLKQHLFKHVEKTIQAVSESHDE